MTSPIRFKADKLSEYGYSSSLEWVETNGLGGYASATVAGTNTRKYHGLLVASKRPPVERNVVLSKLEETIVTADVRFGLSTNQFPGALHPQGYKFLTSFERGLFPEFTYQCGDVQLKKTIAAVHGENTTLILYEVKAGNAFQMELLPLCSARDFHSTTHRNDAIYGGYVFDEGIFQTKNYEDSPELFIAIAGSKFEPSHSWYEKFELNAERERGLDFFEDLYNHGKFTVELKKGDILGVIVSTENPAGKDPLALFAGEKKRREQLLTGFGNHEGIRRLILAADQFIVKRGKDLKTIIAGYHWFSDWGRDTMIALPGLCLSTGRYDDAKKILRAFAQSASEGMLPNRFSDYGEAPEYNTVDATLWFFHAIKEYFAVTRDLKFIKELMPVLRDILIWHDKGTRYGIHMDTDELLYSGQAGVQLTWMDAKVGDWVVTPRQGKAVEINALWIHALTVMADLLAETGDNDGVEHFRARAGKASESFNKVFWNKSKDCLYDYVDGDVKNDDIRPNQIYAISLMGKVLSADRAQKVFNTVTKKLLTPRGLRSLSPDNKEYKARYEGDVWRRDGAYHQGTVWSFLLGPYIDALMNLKGEKGRVEASKIVRTFLEHLNEAGVGTVSEIFDAEPPFAPRGCIAQAWGVAEVLRVSMKHELFPAQI